MAKATTTTTTRPRLFPGRTISPKSSDGRNSTIRPSAASNARSGSGWNTGRSCGRDSPTNRAGKKSATGTSPGIQTINDAVADFLNEARIVMVNTVATQRRGRAVVGERAPPSSGVQTAKVTPDEAGMRVDRFVEARFPRLAFSHIQRIIRKGELRVNGKRAQPKQRLEAGQAVRIPPLRLDQPRPSGRDANVRDQTRAFLKSITLHEDADVLVLDKPMGLAVQGGSGTTRHLDGMLETLRDAQGQRPRLVHRLDKDTAGCLLVAKSRFAASALAKSFRSRSARKIYWALVAGVPKPRQGRISTFLAKEQAEDDSFMRIARHGEEGASHAVTYYAVIDTAARQLAWLSLKPVTGRTHQLRAHMAHIGHPIVGDPKYFNIENWHLPGGIQNKLHLLARRIAVPHPRGGVIDVSAPIPQHMLQSWNLLGFDTKRYDPIEEAPEE